MQDLSINSIDELGSFLGSPYRILDILSVKPRKRATMGTIEGFGWTWGLRMEVQRSG